MDDFNEFKNQLEKSGRRVLEDRYVRQYTKIWNTYLKSIISNYKNKIDLDSKNVEIVVVEEGLKCNAFVQKVGKTYFIAINHYIIKYYHERIREVFLKYDNYIEMMCFFKDKLIASDMNEISFTLRNGPYFNFFNTPDLRYNTFANTVYNNILFFIIFHEFGHIITGQLEEEKTQNIFFELQDQRSGDLEDQGKEFLADFYGTIYTVSTAITYNTLNIKAFTTVIGLLKFSAWCMLSFFTIDKAETDLEISFEEYLEKNSRFKHPPLAVRMHYIELMIEGEIEFTLNKTRRPDWFIKGKNDRKKGLIKYIMFASSRLLFELIKNSEENISLKYGDDVLGTLVSKYYFEVRKSASLVSKKLKKDSFVNVTIQEEISESEEDDIRELEEFETKKKHHKEAFNSYVVETIDGLLDEVISNLSKR